MVARRDPTFVFLAVVAVVVALGVGAAVVLGGGDEEAALPTTTTVPVDPAETCPGADGRSRELRRCLEPSFAFVETDFAAGSGVLLPDGHVLTNAHVVDPFERVDVTFPGGERHEDVRVVGVDAFADIAVLDVVDTDRAGITVGPSPDLDADEEPEVFLVGYPGAVEGDDPQITLASGILSRVRQVETFDATYLQTDAAIAGGQSGGALVDSDGRLLGISGLGFAEEFALALSADDVLDSIERILDEGGDERRTVPGLDDAGSDPVTVELPVRGASAIGLIPAKPDERTVRIAVTSDRPVAISVSTAFGEPLGANQAGIDLAQQFLEELPGGGTGFPGDNPPLLPEVAPGTWDVEIPSDELAFVSVSFADQGAGSVTLDLDSAFVAYGDMAPPRRIDLGDSIETVADGFSFEQLYTIDLEAGDEVEIGVRSAAADAYYILLPPGEEYDPTQEPTTDDGGGGLYDLDAVDTHTVDATGTYTIVVGTYDGIVTGYQLSVSRAS